MKRINPKPPWKMKIKKRNLESVDSSKEPLRTSLSGQSTASSRGPKPSLSTEGIALAAIKIADAEGLGAVSMQRVASAFGFTNMALYRYIPDKDALIGMMLETSLGDAPGLTGAAAGWRAKLTEWTRAISDRIRRHPWALDVLNQMRVPGPRELSWMEAGLAAFEGTSLSGQESLDVLGVLIAHIRIVKQYSAKARTNNGGTGEWNKGLATVVSARPDLYPRLAESLRPHSVETLDGNRLAFGIERMLDGIELLISSRTPSEQSRYGAVKTRTRDRHRR